MSIADKLSEIASDLPRVFEAGEKKHTARYKTALVAGDGTNIISFEVPFEPDCVFVTAHGAEATTSVSGAMQMIFDIRSFANIGGMYRVRQNSKNTQGAISSASGKNYFRIADGLCSVEVPSVLNSVYPNGVQYIITAVKYTDKSDRELLYDEISMLADMGGAVEYSSARVLATVSEEEWQTLIASKPNRTFTLK